MSPRLYRLGPVFAMALASIPAFGWNATGHMIIAAVAERNLTPTAKSEVDRLLKISPTDQAYDFVTTGPWADDVRRDRPETGPWHYIDIYFRQDGKPATHQPDAENVVVEINKFTVILKDRSKPDADRAEALRFLIHFVGDVHQPLHATSRESDAHPAGDRGGNDFHIVPPTSFGTDRFAPKNLHALWDDGCGSLPYKKRPLSDEDKSWIESRADGIAQDVPKDSVPQAKDLNPQDWALESLQLAKTQVYGFEENSMPSDAYLKAGQQTTEKRLALAGYRLAGLLNKALAD